MRTFIFNRIANIHDSRSLARRLRKRRLEFFSHLLLLLPRPIKILDVGGTLNFWTDLGFVNDGVTIVLMNVRPVSVDHPSFEAIVGDARDLHAFDDASIDVVYSNSVIEHVGDINDQRQMAAEIQRVAKRYFVQTPSANFPIEPHFLFPGFQFLPLGFRAFLLTKFRLGSVARQPDPARAREIVASVKLLTPAQVRGLFPGATFYEERVLGLTKSIIAYHGW